MRFFIPHSGGRVVIGDTACGSFRVEWDSTGKLISESCTIIEAPSPPPKPGKRDPCPACGGELVGSCTRHCNRCGLRLGCGE